MGLPEQNRKCSRVHSPRLSVPVCLGSCNVDYWNFLSHQGPGSPSSKMEGSSVTLSEFRYINSIRKFLLIIKEKVPFRESKVTKPLKNFIRVRVRVYVCVCLICECFQILRVFPFPGWETINRLENTVTLVYFYRGSSEIFLMFHTILFVVNYHSNFTWIDIELSRQRIVLELYKIVSW